MWNRVSPRNYTLDRAQIPTREGAILSHLRAKRGRPRTFPDMSCGRYTQSDSAGGSTGTVRIPIGCTRLGCTLAPPGECDGTVRVRRRCGLMSNYFDHLLLLLLARPHRTTYINAAYCYRPNSVVCRWVCQSVSPIEMPFRLRT